MRRRMACGGSWMRSARSWGARARLLARLSFAAALSDPTPPCQQLPLTTSASLYAYNTAQYHCMSAVSWRPRRCVSFLDVRCYLRGERGRRLLLRYFQGPRSRYPRTRAPTKKTEKRGESPSGSCWPSVARQFQLPTSWLHQHHYRRISPDTQCFSLCSTLKLKFIAQASSALFSASLAHVLPPPPALHRAAAFSTAPLARLISAINPIKPFLRHPQNYIRPTSAASFAPQPLAYLALPNFRHSRLQYPCATNVSFHGSCREQR